MKSQKLHCCVQMTAEVMSLLVLIFIPFINGFSIDVDGKDHNNILEMPGAVSPAEDSYRCTAFQVKNNDPVYINQFTANANASKAHHIIVQKCPKPMKEPGQIWDCRHHSTCQGPGKIMYAWARDAPPTFLPDDVGFKLFPNEYIVVQIHYAIKFSEPDHTSITVKMTSKKPKYFAGIYLLVKGWFPIPPGKKESNADINCRINADPPLHVFAFRPHAHTLGRKIIGVKKSPTSGELEVFAEGDPLKPQAFYPLKKPITLSKGDIAFARCVYDSTSKTTTTNIGATAGDEMCNLYLMYYNENEQHDFFQCFQEDDRSMSRQVDEKLKSIANEIVKPEPKSISVPKQPIQKPFIGHKMKLNFEIGDICGISYDIFGNIVLLNRGNHHWDANTFDWGNKYSKDHNEPIEQDTVITINSTGHVISSWGSNFFFLPHMVTIDGENNVWITDVAMHQVFKFGPYGGPTKKPLVELGTKFEPGGDERHYCKPTAVAVMADSRTFFVADGYCNQRIIKYIIRSVGPNGYHSVVKLTTFGATNIPFQTNIDAKVYNFRVPHALAIFEDQQMICVADRENSVVQCFNLEDGTYKRTINTIENNSKIYSIHPAESQLAVIMGPSAKSASKLFLYDINTNEATEAKLSEYEQISNPHDVSMTPNGQNVVVANLNPPQVWLFENQSLINIGRADVVPVKIAESRESPALSKSYDQPPKSPWNVLLLLVVFTTGGTMILYYIRVMRRKRAGGEGFQPLNTKEDFEDNLFKVHDDV